MPNVQAPAFTSALLGRDPEVVYGAEATALIEDQVVLVSGAGGSIGSELVRQVSRLRPRRLYLLDHDESALHAVQLDLHGHGLFEDDSVILCDIRDSVAVDRALAATQPAIVFHAAAHKHLPLLERYPSEGVKTNVFGTWNLVQAAALHGVDRFVNISTDKAARPSSILGATKRLAELVVAAHAGPDLKVASVRFGNVLGSRGSFLHGLASQVDRGQQITITDPNVTRFFMTIPEAAGLVIEASVLAHAGETYVLDMGEPVRIIDLVLKYLTLTGLSAPGITFTGLRPGEKLHESLFDSAELGQATPHPKISAVSQRKDVTDAVASFLPALQGVLDGGDASELREHVMALVPDERVTPAATQRSAPRELALA